MESVYTGYPFVPDDDPAGMNGSEILDASIAVRDYDGQVYLDRVSAPQTGGDPFVFRIRSGSTVEDLLVTPAVAGDTVVSSGDSFILKLRVGDGFDYWLDSIASSGPGTAAPIERRFESRCVVIEHGLVRRIVLRNPGEEDIEVGPGHITLQPGWNTDFEQVENTLRVNAEPGLGAGVPDCDIVAEFDRRPRIRPDAFGGVRVTGDPCLDISPLASEDDSRVFVVSSPCTACCSCEKYYNVYKAVSGRIGAAHTIRKRFDSVTTRLAASQQGDVHLRAVDGATMRIRTYAHPRFHTVSGGADKRVFIYALVSGPQASYDIKSLAEFPTGLVHAPEFDQLIYGIPTVRVWGDDVGNPVDTVTVETVASVITYEVIWCAELADSATGTLTTILKLTVDGVELDEIEIPYTVI